MRAHALFYQYQSLLGIDEKPACLLYLLNSPLFPLALAYELLHCIPFLANIRFFIVPVGLNFIIAL